jgi:hypothetical protein
MRPGAGTGRRHRAARSALWQPDLADCGHSEVSPGAPAPQACRLRDGVPGRVGRTRISYAIRLAPIMDATALRAARPHPPAGGRGDGRRASGAGIGRRASGCGKSAQWGAPARSTTPSPAHHGCGALRPPRIPSATPAVAATDSGRLARGRAGGTGRAKHVLPPNTGSRKHPPAHLRHGRAGCASASRRSGRSPTFLDSQRANIGRHPSAGPAPIMDAAPPRPSHIPTRTPAVAATERGRREARYATQPRQPEVIGRRNRATGVQAAPGIAVKWPLTGFPGRSALRPPRIPIRAPAVAATGNGAAGRNGPTALAGVYCEGPEQEYK